MKTTKSVTVKLLSLILAMAIVACSKSDDGDGTDPDGNPDPEPMAETIAELIANGDDFEDFPASRETDTTAVGEPFNEDFDATDGSDDENRWICTTKTVSVLDGNGQFPLFNTNASVIWPGNLLQGRTLSNATPSDIPVRRLGGKITYDLVTGNPVATRDVDIIDQGTVAQAMNDIIAENGDVVPANFDLTVESIQSKEQLALEMGLDVSTFTTKVSSNFSLNTSSEFSSVLVKLTQGYYTMSYVTPTSVDDFFDPSVTVDELDGFVQSDNPATFISSVTYGRIFYMLYESTASSQEMEFALKGAYNGLTAQVQGSVDLDFLREYKNLSIKVIAYGGDAQGTFETVGAVLDGEEGVNNLQELLNRLGESTDIRAGLPVSYVVKSVENRSQIVGTKIATEYDVVNCEFKGTLPPNLYSDLLDLFDDGIGAMLNIKGSNVIVFNKAGDRYAWYNGEIPGIYKEGGEPVVFAVNDSNTEFPIGPLGNLALNDVGAAVDFSSNVAYIFNGSGTECQIMTVDPNKIPNSTLPTEQVVTYSTNNSNGGSFIFFVNNIFGSNGSGTFQLSNGIGAGISTGYPTMAFFQRDETNYQRYRSDNNGTMFNPQPSTGWFNDEANADNRTLFSKVGAATKFNLGGTSTRYLFVNEAGDEIMQWFSIAGPGDTFEGPWVIN